MKTRTGLILAATVFAIGIPGAVMMGHQAAHVPQPHQAAHVPQPPPAAPVSPEQKYIDSIVSQGLLAKPDAERHRDKLVDLGQMACTEKSNGMDDNEIIPLIRAQGELNSHQADIILIAASLDLCR
jgi:hypothetical protein